MHAVCAIVIVNAAQALESLNVAYCGAITDCAMRSLSRLTALTRLNFGRCNKVEPVDLRPFGVSEGS